MKKYFLLFILFVMFIFSIYAEEKFDIVQKYKEATRYTFRYEKGYFVFSDPRIMMTIQEVTLTGVYLEKMETSEIRKRLISGLDSSCEVNSFTTEKDFLFLGIINGIIAPDKESLYLGLDIFSDPNCRKKVRQFPGGTEFLPQIVFYPNQLRIPQEKKSFIDKGKVVRYVLMNYYDLAKNKDFAYQGCEPALLKLFAWEPYGRYWELKAKDFEALKKMNELKISAFEKLLKKTENDPQFAKLYLENRPDSYNPERRIIKRKPEALEKAWQKFSARWEKENLKLVPKFKIIPLLPESDSQMKK